MPRYLYATADLSRSGTLDTDDLVATTERHKISFEIPPLKTTPAEAAISAIGADVDGVVLQLAKGFLNLAQLRIAGRVLRAGKRLWIHWPAEAVIECVDGESLVSHRRHWAVVVAYYRVYLPVYLPLMRAKAKAAIEMRRLRVLAHLKWLINVAAAVPVRRTSGGRAVAGRGAYLRTDFWAPIASGGSYGHTCYVAKELAGMAERFVCFMAHRYSLLDESGLEQIVMTIPPKVVGGEDEIVMATPHYHRQLRAQLEALKPDYLYERLCLGNYAGALASQELRIPYIVEYNGSEISMRRSFDRGRYVYEDVYLKAEELAFKQATLISVVSEPVRDDLVARGINPAKIFVNPNGADIDAYAPPSPAARDQIRAELGFTPADRVIGFTGTFGGWHGVDVLAAAIPRICAEEPSSRFLLIGDGNYKHLTDAAVANGKLQEKVKSVGRVPQQEGARLLKACDIFVSPHNSHMIDSRFFGSPTKVFEYMALGRAIVASDLEQIGEVLRPALTPSDLVTGKAVAGARSVLCPPGDLDQFILAVVALARSPELCDQLGQGARRAVVEHYSWKQHVARLWDALSSLDATRKAS
jgi:glycosyltransferase involved in cell wall biosynthesis